MKVIAGISSVPCVGSAVCPRRGFPIAGRLDRGCLQDTLSFRHSWLIAMQNWLAEMAFQEATL